MNKNLIRELRLKSIRLRTHLLAMFEPGKVGHWGGSSSIMDVMAVLYFYKMTVNPQNPQDGDRDYLIMSKGHTVPAQYAALAELGFFPPSELANLKTLRGILQGHPDLMTPGIEAVTGSLGQGLSIAAGIAYSLLRVDQKPNKVFAICGDGEMAEGQIWEAALFAAHYKLSNLTVIIDWNKIQASGRTEDVLGIPNLGQKWESFGWKVFKIDGHDIAQIIHALDEDSGARPKLILADTVKGKGFSFAEDKPAFHNGAVSPEEYTLALKELEKARKDVLNEV